MWSCRIGVDIYLDRIRGFWSVDKYLKVAKRGYMRTLGDVLANEKEHKINRKKVVIEQVGKLKDNSGKSHLDDYDVRTNGLEHYIYKLDCKFKSSSYDFCHIKDPFVDKIDYLFSLKKKKRMFVQFKVCVRKEKAEYELVYNGKSNLFDDMNRLKESIEEILASSIPSSEITNL